MFFDHNFLSYFEANGSICSNILLKIVLLSEFIVKSISRSPERPQKQPNKFVAWRRRHCWTPARWKHIVKLVWWRRSAFSSIKLNRQRQTVKTDWMRNSVSSASHWSHPSLSIRSYLGVRSRGDWKFEGGGGKGRERKEVISFPLLSPLFASLFTLPHQKRLVTSWERVCAFIHGNG